jgi:hypothetical protein
MEDIAIGDTIELVHTTDQYTKLKPGDTGTVRSIRDDPFATGARIFSIDWENGSRLSMVEAAGDMIKRVG